MIMYESLDRYLLLTPAFLIDPIPFRTMPPKNCEVSSENVGAPNSQDCTKYALHLTKFNGSLKPLKIQNNKMTRFGAKCQLC